MASIGEKGASAVQLTIQPYIDSGQSSQNHLSPKWLSICSHTLLPLTSTMIPRKLNIQSH